MQDQDDDEKGYKCVRIEYHGEGIIGSRDQGMNGAREQRMNGSRDQGINGSRFSCLMVKCLFRVG